ncbi:MAG: RNA-directed DNA polymerase, partial [Propionibacteriaceae bacterium]|nr:RNA-directed DNA polymerase [Propionibacteriaceae bacterium]
DIRDYFNSIDIETLLPILHQTISDDPPLFSFLKKLLTADAAWFNGEVVTLKRGVMAGIPLAGFLANLYLGELDRYFVNNGCPYARYSDDIVVFADTESELVQHRLFIHEWLKLHGLAVNTRKEFITPPGQTWEFLGIAFCEGEIQISKTTELKLKAKIRRKARALRRWMLRSQAQPDQAVGVMIRVFNRKLFLASGNKELNWSRWFFPLLTSDETLRTIDSYLQQYLRWIPSGRHSRSNYRTDYDTLKRLGYRTLVNEFHRYRKLRAE